MGSTSAWGRRQVLVACSNESYAKNYTKVEQLTAAGVEVLPLATNIVTKKLDLQQLLDHLGARGIDSLLVDAAFLFCDRRSPVP